MRRVTAVLLVALAACRTTRPPNAQPIPPLTSASPAEAERQLETRRGQFTGERSLLRIHLGSLSARGQLQVDGKLRILLTVYTPLGTTAARLYAAGDEVLFLNDLESTAWRGKPGDLSGTLGVFSSPAAALLLVGLPPADAAVTYSATGIQEARYGDAVVRYDPPVYPPKRLIIERGGRRVELEHLESYASSDPVERPAIPEGYRCCVLPQL
jgi:hypothetical protein